MFLPGSAGIGLSMFFFFHKGEGSSVAEPHRASAGLSAILNCGLALTPFTFSSFSEKSTERQQKLNPVHRLQPFWVQDKFLGGLMCDFILGWTQTREWKSPLGGAHLMYKRNRTGMKQLAGTEEGKHIEKVGRDWDYKEEVEVSRREQELSNGDIELQEKTMNRGWKGQGSSKVRWEQSWMEAGYRHRDWRICSHWWTLPCTT